MATAKKIKSSGYTSGKIATEKENSSYNSEEWKSALGNLSAEIKIRHYSPKTLKTYTLWVKKFQGFTRNTDPQLLSSNNVKEFLTFLAIKRKVSASTQNQAFNALLSFYRHVIKKDFDNLKDAPLQFIPTQ